jgi:hypothetical protein
MEKTIRKVTDLEEQQAETYCHWQSRPVVERLRLFANSAKRFMLSKRASKQ